MTPKPKAKKATMGKKEREIRYYEYASGWLAGYKNATGNYPPREKTLRVYRRKWERLGREISRQGRRKGADQ